MFYYDDLRRLRGQRGRLLELLLDGEWHRNHDCAEVGGLSFNDSIFAFRQQGWIIESRKLRGGIWEFRLTGKGDPPEGHKAMSRPQRYVAAHYLYVIKDKLGETAMKKVLENLPNWMHAAPHDPDAYVSTLPGSTHD
jgi:hypothetical protein